MYSGWLDDRDVDRDDGGRDDAPDDGRGGNGDVAVAE
jgi:hypothetical protein